MRIGLVILHADPRRGGAERYTVDLAEALAAEGEDVSLIASSFGEVPGEVRSLVAAAPGWTRSGRYLRFLGSVDQILDREKFDVVHAALPVRRCDVYHPHAGLALDAVLRGHQKRTGWGRWWSRIGNRLNGRRQLFASVEQKLLGGDQPPIVISLSDYVGAGIAETYRLPASQVVKLFNAVDIKRFDPARVDLQREQLRANLDLASDDVAVLMIAQDFERKGLPEALKAIASVGTSRLKLIVVGKQPTGPYEQLAESLKIRHRVIFAGPTLEPERFYAAADAFVLPTRHDPCSLVVLEALAMGLPVISTRFNGACEIMNDGEHGTTVSSADDHAGLAVALAGLLDDGLRAEQNRACLELRPILSHTHHLQRLRGIYGQAMLRHTAIHRRAA
jgi:UDP-glucose:(heptosyl)LPS alpha-1,3-glucosyltransferase